MITHEDMDWVYGLSDVGKATEVKAIKIRELQVALVREIEARSKEIDDAIADLENGLKGYWTEDEIYIAKRDYTLNR